MKYKNKKLLVTAWGVVLIVALAVVIGVVRQFEQGADGSSPICNGNGPCLAINTMPLWVGVELLVLASFSLGTLYEAWKSKKRKS